MQENGKLGIEMVAECSKILIQAKTRRSLSRTLSGKPEGAGWGEEPVGNQAREPSGSADTRAQSRATRSSGGRQEGCKPDCQKRRDFRPGMTLLSATNASVDSRAGRPSRSQCGFSDCAGPAEAARDPAQGASELV